MNRALTLILLLTVALGSATVQAGSVAGLPPRVTVIGDSIAAAMAYDQTARSVLARGVDLDLQAAVCRRHAGDSCPYQGSRPSTLVDLLPSLRLGSTVVVAVGYNDYEETFAATVETALQALEKAGVEHILWLTLRAERESYLHMNDLVRTAAERHVRVKLVDWDLYSRNHPDWFQPDGLHLTAVGAIAMATLVHRSLDQLGLVIAPPVPALTIVTRKLPAARVGRPYVARLAASGGTLPIRWIRAAGAIPAGLALRREGRVSGTPRVAGRRVIALRVTDARGRSASRRFLLSVAAR